MTDVLKHRFTSAKADGGDVSQVQPSHWNDGHKFIGGAVGDLLQRDPADVAFGAKWASSAWITPAFVASDYFISIGTGTWPVASSDIVYCRYSIMGRTLFWMLGINPVPFTGVPLGFSRKPFGGIPIVSIAAGIYLIQPKDGAYYQTAIGGASQINFFKDINGTQFNPGDSNGFRASGFYEIAG